MFESRHHALLALRAYVFCVARNLFIEAIIIALCLVLGMYEYHHFEGMHWVDAFVNAAMILSGMGPVSPLHTEGGKIFAGSYALLAGLFFLWSS